jgi:predicted ATPase/class 3 adenylate cyclase
VTSAPDRPTGTVTFLFTDVEGSTRLLRRLGDDFRVLIDDHNRLLSEAFRDGYVVRTEGDAFFVVFTSATAAVRAAIAAQRALRAHAWPDDVAVKVRMGLHTGDGVLAGGDYAGIDVHRAARIAAAAHGEQVLVSDATRALVDGSLADGVHLRDLGDHRLKDLPRPERLWQVTVPGLPSEFPVPRSLDARPNNLPTNLTPFIGREQVIDDVKRLCGTSRLVTLTGPGGTGKTRLALQVAAEVLPMFPDGAYFVYLEPIADPDLVPGTIAKALDVMEERGRSLVDTLKDHLCDKDMLLVLDNFEQVVDAAPVVPELMMASEGLRALVTSREPLHVDGEQEYPVPPMTLPDTAHLPPPDDLSAYESVALFVSRARGVQPSFELTEQNAATVAEICRRLDGLPLAIELAAARVRLLPPPRLLERLERALPILSGGGRDRPTRQQTLRDAIAWSHDLLDDDERAVFRRLAAFVGGCTLEAAERVCDVDGTLEGRILDLIGSLLDKSLLVQIEVHDEPRFIMLQTIGEFARERLDTCEERQTVLRRHAELFLELVEEVAPKLTGKDQAMWLDRLEDEHDNVRAALGWAAANGETEIALRLAATSWRFWQMRGHLREARERLEQVLALPDVDEHPEAHAAALEAAGGIVYWMGELAEAGRLYDACLALRRSIDDPVALAEAAYNRACIAAFARDENRSAEVAEALLSEALGIFTAADDELGIAKVLWATGGNLIDRDALASIGPFHESLDHYRAVGDRFGESWALHMLGTAEVIAGRIEDAERHIREALDAFVAADDRSSFSILLYDFSIIATYRDELPRALRLAGAAEAVEARSGVGLGMTASEVAGVFERMRSTLPADETERYLAEGRAMSVEDALAYATKREG